MKRLLIIILSLTAIYSCEEIVSVEDISEEMIEVLAPVDDAILNTEEVTFSWAEIDFADRYHIQVAKPAFAQATQVVLDSFLGDSIQTFRNLTVTLMPGSYEWRVSGLNSNYSTDYTTQSFTIDTIVEENPVDISNQLVEITAPSDNVVLSSNNVNFSWENLASNTGYRIQVAIPDFQNPEQLVLDTTTVNTSFNIELVDGPFEWRIQAFNEVFSTDFTTQGFSIVTDSDISNEIVSLLAPSDGFVVNDTNVTFSWEPVSEATSYNLQIARPGFENAEELLVNESFDTSSNQSFILEDNNSYQWRVKALNETSETVYTTRAFSVNVTEELSEQEIVVVSPENGFETSETSVNFIWEALEQATIYRVVITDVSDNSVFLEESTTASTLTVEFELGQYVWAVRAENESDNTPYTEQTISIVE